MGPLRKKLADRIEAKLIEEAVKRGASEKEAREAVEDVAGERPILEWLLAGGWEKLLAMVLRIISLFASDKK